MVGIARCPRTTCHHIGPLTVRRQIARLEAVRHRQTVKEWLDGRPHLPASQTHHIIHEMSIIQSTHIRFHSTRLRIHAHKTATQKTLVITDRIERTHQRINITMIGKYGHLLLLAECRLDFILRISRSLHRTVTLTLGDTAVQYTLNLLRCQLIAVWRAWFAGYLCTETRLQIAGYMLIHSLFRILLYTAIDSCKHLQSITVYIIWRTILLIVLVAPSIERIILPLGRIHHKLGTVPGWIITALRTLSHHILAKELTQISSRTILMVGTVEIECQRLSSILAILAPAQISRLHHLRKNHISALPRSLRIANRIEERRILAQSDERCRLTEGQILRFLIKIGIGRRLDSYSIVQEIEVIEIESQNLLFGIIAFQLHRNHPLYRLLQQSFHRTACLLRIKLLGELLRDGTSTTRISLSQDTTLDDGTSQCTEVDT